MLCVIQIAHNLGFLAICDLYRVFLTSKCFKIDPTQLLEFAQVDISCIQYHIQCALMCIKSVILCSNFICCYFCGKDTIVNIPSARFTHCWVQGANSALFCQERIMLHIRHIMPSTCAFNICCECLHSFQFSSVHSFCKVFGFRFRRIRNSMWHVKFKQFRRYYVVSNGIVFAPLSLLHQISTSSGSATYNLITLESALQRVHSLP